MAYEPDTISDLRFEINSGGKSRLTVLLSDGGSHEYQVSFSACPNPVCGCYSVDLECFPDGELRAAGADPCIIKLDIRDQEARQKDNDAQRRDRYLSQTVAAALTADQWRRLRAWLVTRKREAMAEMDLDSLDPDFDPEIMTDGRMVSYDEIFPFAKPLEFKVDDQLWIADDQYCVKPNCTCAEAILSFTPLPMNHPGNGFPVYSIPTAAAIRYNIRRRSTKVEDSPPVSSATARKLMTTLEEQHEDFPTLLAKRRRQLRYLYRKMLERLPKPTSPPPPATPTKIGRNLPCPCGSGKKYKRCCGK